MKVKRIVLKLESEYRKKGFKYAFQKFLRKLIGVDNDIETLQYLLNQIHTPSEVGPTKDKDLRIMQQCDATLLAIFHAFCMRHNLSYWLDYGTLLGAVRHDGFIPWDDDMDVAMPRSDYETMIVLAKQELVPLGFDVEEKSVGRLTGFSYKHELTGIWLDIFPIDELSSNEELENVAPYFSVLTDNYRKFWKKRKDKYDAKYFNEMRCEMINSKISTGINEFLYHSPEFKYLKNLIHKKDEIFPLSLHNFEGYEFKIPCKVDNYLIRIYGIHYMEFPTKGVLKHDLGRGMLSTWASKNGVDMKDVKKQLEEILINYTSIN